MYAVIRTGGKQYRVQPGDLLVVEKLPGDAGATVAFDDVLMIGRGDEVSLGAPTVAGAKVEATLIETRKGEKIKVFKKIRRKGYRRTRGHRQSQSVLRVTGIAADGVSESWDGTVDLTPLAVLNARARNLARGMEAAEQARRAKASARARPLAKPTDEPITETAGEEPAVAAPASPARKRQAAGAKTRTPKAASAKAEGAAEPADKPKRTAAKRSKPDGDSA